MSEFELSRNRETSRQAQQIQMIPGGGEPEVMRGPDRQLDYGEPLLIASTHHRRPEIMPSPDRELGYDEPIERLSKLLDGGPDRREPMEQVSKRYVAPDRLKPMERVSKDRTVQARPVEELPAVRALSESLPVALPPGAELLSVYLLERDQYGREVLCERPLSPAVFELALDRALKNGVTVLVGRDQDGTRLVPAELTIAQADRPFTLHDAVNGAHVTLAVAGGKTMEGIVKLAGWSDTSARVAGKVTDAGLRLLFKPSSAGLEVGVMAIEVASFLLPAGDRGDPHVIDLLVRRWVKDALDR